jgi:hypothetical protein
MQIGPGCVFPVDAIVLHALDAGGAGARYGFFVDDTVLEPEVRDAETDDIVDSRRDILGGAEDIDKIDSGAGKFARRGLCCV